jgi:hypothetical protein
MSSDRRDQFKQPISPEEARARRSELSVSVRKVKREGNLLKRRALRASPALGAPGYGPTDPRSWSAAAPTEGTAYSSHASPSTPALADGTNEMDAASSGNISGSLGLGASDSSSLSQGAGLEYSPLSPTDTAATIDSSAKASVDALATSLLTAPTLEGALAAACGVRRLLASDHPPTELMVSACEGKLVPRLLDLLCNEVRACFLILFFLADALRLAFKPSYPPLIVLHSTTHLVPSVSSPARPRVRSCRPSVHGP